MEVPGAYFNTWNVKYVKRFIPRDRAPQLVNILPPPKFTVQDNSVHLTPLRILKERRYGTHQVQQYLMSLEGFGPEHDAWIDVEVLKQMYGTRLNRCIKQFGKSRVQ